MKHLNIMQFFATLSFLLCVVLQLEAAVVPPKPPSIDILNAEGAGNLRVSGQSVTTSASPINRAGWTISADSQQPGNEATNALDGNTGSIWHSAYSPTNAPLPHRITIDMKAAQNVQGITYLPRQDGNSNGNWGQHTVELSSDGTKYVLVAKGTYLDDKTLKTTIIETRPARYVRITAITEAGGRGPWSSAAEINVLAAPSYTPPANGVGKWGPTIDFPIVPVAAAVLHDTGKVLTWSSYAPGTFTGGPGGITLTATYDPSAGTVSQRTVTNTQHDMFCPGISIDQNGRPLVTGGNNAEKTSIYDPSSDAWTPGGNMVTPRGYQASAALSDGRIFTIGGSWSGGQGNKNGEIFSLGTNSWSSLPGCPVAPMLTADAQGVYRADNHGWLFGWKGSSVFQAGPSKAMNWYGTSGRGSQGAAGTRAADGDSMCGNAVMYDAAAGKILTVGGSPSYQDVDATSNAHIVSIGNPFSTASTQKVKSMSYARAFANAVVLPDGTTFVTGGQSHPVPFSDDTAILTPEIFNPATNTFTKMAPNSIPRTYHSVALLLLDGTVFSGGGGLCGSCSTNHYDAQIYSPPYLFNADGSTATRPAINSVSPTSMKIGATITITTNSAVTKFSLIRYGSTTHTVDTDQRRIALSPTSTNGNTYTVVVPNDAGITLPGYWMLFALTSKGVPSVAKTVRISAS